MYHKIYSKLLSNRLKEIADIMEAVDRRCEASDGPVAKFQDEVTDEELRKIYILASKGIK
jgi:hypothetical protein